MRTSSLLPERTKGGIKLLRSCKNIDITNWETILPWVSECLFRHKKRYDFRKFTSQIADVSRNEVDRAIKSRDNELFEESAELIAKRCAAEIKARSLSLEPVVYRTRVDPSTGKVRDIGCEGPMQQMYDYIAVHSCEEIWRRRIVPQQIAGFPNRGPNYGVNMIRKWIVRNNYAMEYNRNHKIHYSNACKYHAKLDIKKCYPSMRVSIFIKLFRRDCANKDLLWLWETLLASHKVDGHEGFMIGALCSQFACQYVLSFLYRYAMEFQRSYRGSMQRCVTHALFQMDDILLFGSNRRSLRIAVESLIKYAKTFGLTVKDNWHIVTLQYTPVDIVGYKIYASGIVKIRNRVFLRARRVALRAKAHMDVQRARRLLAYKGYFIHSNSDKFVRDNDLQSLWHKASKIISNYDKEVNYRNGTCILQQRT